MTSVVSVLVVCAAQDDSFLAGLVKEREEELTKKTLTSLNEMRIKFPGKTDTEAELLLDKVQVYWTGTRAPEWYMCTGVHQTQDP